MYFKEDLVLPIAIVSHSLNELHLLNIEYWTSFMGDTLAIEGIGALWA